MFDIKHTLVINKMKNDNYLLNCYRRLIRSKLIHFLLILIEIVLIFLQEIDTFYRGFKPRYKTEGKLIINPMILIIHLLDNYDPYIKFLIILLSILIFDSIYLLISRKDIKERNILVSVLINFLELFYFRLYASFFFHYIIQFK